MIGRILNLSDPAFIFLLSFNPDLHLKDTNDENRPKFTNFALTIDLFARISVCGLRGL